MRRMICWRVLGLRWCRGALKRAKQNIEDDNYQKPRDLPFKREDIIDAEFEDPK